MLPLTYQIYVGVDSLYIFYLHKRVAILLLGNRKLTNRTETIIP